MMILAAASAARTFTCDFRKVVFLDELAEDPIGTLERVFSFLGMDLLDEKGEQVLNIWY